MTILSRKFTKIFLLKLLYKTYVSNLMHFQEKWFIFFLKKKVLGSESVDNNKRDFYSAKETVYKTIVNFN